MHRVALFAVLTGILFVVHVANGAVALGRVDTSSGFCKTPYGRIPLGKTHHFSNECVSVECQPGIFHITGCGMVVTDDPKCRVVRRKGKPPKCCPRIKCRKG